ncbi:hypothetical protein HZH66_014641 [Vespula vulgaris]|uniref:Reverse transcriptase n=1 Tax=Vespula vulgaris TaxID=7454 RepID=A0A834J157_VESVU|nr:hypothetical protein HZH66_014641 [Vespula vulgaris]
MITKTSESRYEQILQYEKLDALNDEEKEVAKIIIKNLIDLFHLSGDKLIHKIIDHNIEIINLMPISIVLKKPDSNGNKRWRLVIDYRMLNEKTVKDGYPLLNITEILNQLGSTKYFIIEKVDSISGPHQLILITEIEVNRNFPYEGFPPEGKGTPQKEFIFPEAHAS